ncbi:MAG: hypothetical protein WCF78_02920 [archaeon]
MKLIVGDASSLILLAKANILDDLLELTDIIVPTIVYDEIMKGKEKNKQDAYYIEQLINLNKIKIEDPQDINVSQIKFLYSLDAGELYAITLAKEKSIDLLIDDRDGIIVCHKLNVRIHTALMILEELIIGKFISIDKARFALALLIENGRYTSEDIKNINERVGL